MTSPSQVTAASEGQFPSQESADIAGLGPIAHSRDPQLAPSLASTLTKAHVDFASFHEGYIRSYIALADTKATMVFGVAAALLTYLFSRREFEQVLFQPTWTILFVQVLTAVGFLGLAAVCAVMVITPRLSHSGEGIVFFGSVAAYPSGESYLDALAKRDEAGLTAARLRHCYDTARTCVRKYDMLRRAIVFGFLGVASSLLVLSV